MSRLETDVLVVGAGPGGSATAYHLARHGIDVTVVERSAFPREKVCGDGLTPRGVAALLKMGVDPAEPGPRLAVRSLDDFTAWVDPTTRSTAPAGTPGAVRRFTFVPELSSETP